MVPSTLPVEDTNRSSLLVQTGVEDLFSIKKYSYINIAPFYSIYNYSSRIQPKNSYIEIRQKSPYIEIKTKTPYIEIKTKSPYTRQYTSPYTSPYTKYITVFDKNNTSYALHLNYAILSSWLHNIVHKPSG
jgi:hypothetical protein